MSEPELQHPWRRRELLLNLQQLASLSHQQRRWLRREPIADRWDTEIDELDSVLHFLFDDTQLFPKAESEVGCFLYNTAEAKAIDVVTCMLDRLIKRLGDVPDAAYLEQPEWPEVMLAACEAIYVLARAGADVIAEFDQ